ncbi:SDR family oxidoreductase [Nonomuraea jabiensis]|uniref:SDR family NAD(P)-dependent oxidoreductase n=1 Tax=Nonomuraea jabiensis TaxID=882448 RepID=UPI003427B989
MLLQNKNAVIYGGGGDLGAGVARTYAREGAQVFLAGRTREKLEAVARDIKDAGGNADVAVLDALDENAVQTHLEAVVAQAGGIDISFNLTTRGDRQGTPLVELPVADFIGPITTGATTNFITARAAARHMIRQGSGVILAIDSGSAHGSPLMGATGPADALLDTFIRNLAVEIGPHGVRALGIWTSGVEDAVSPAKLTAVNPALQVDEATFRGVLEHLSSVRALRRSPRVAQVAATAAFLASDYAAAITGTFVNVTSGTFPS